MEKRLDELEQKLLRLTETIQRVAERVARLEEERHKSSVPFVAHGAPPEDAVAIAPQPDLRPEGPPERVEPTQSPRSAWEDLFPSGLPVLQLVSLTGQMFLIFGGAYLLRAIAYSEILPFGLTLAAGFLHALVWLVVSERCGSRGNALGATFFGTAAVMIAYPLIWETATRSGALPSGMDAAVTGACTALALGLACWRRLTVLAWFVMVAAIGTSVGLMFSTRIIEPHLLLLLLLGVATVWIAYGRGCFGLAWPAALAVDAVTLLAVTLAARAEGHSSSWAELSSPVVLALALGLPFAYLASFAVQTLLRQKDVHAFEMLQTGTALVIGISGAIPIANAMGYATEWLGALILVLAVTSYSVAFLFTRLRWKHRMNFHYYAWLALALTVTGGSLVTGSLSRQLLWCGLTVATAFLGIVFRRLTLHYHSVVYAIVAAVSSGLAAGALTAFFAPAAQPRPLPSFGATAAFVSALVAYAAMSSSMADPRRVWGTQVLRFLAACVTALGGATMMVLTIRYGVERGAAKPDAALFSLIRTSVIMGFAVVLTFLGRGSRFPELRWLLYVLIVIGGIKLLADDLAVGRAATLFPAFALYGITLILAARMVQHVRKAGASDAMAEAA